MKTFAYCKHGKRYVYRFYKKTPSLKDGPVFIFPRGKPTVLF